MHRSGARPRHKARGAAARERARCEPLHRRVQLRCTHAALRCDHRSPAARRRQVARAAVAAIDQNGAVGLTASCRTSGARSTERPSRKSPRNNALQRLKIPQRPAGQRRLRVARKRDGIDVERTGVDPDLLTVGDEPGRCGPVDQWPQLGKAPAQLAFRVIGDVPKQLTELFAGDRARRHREISEERPDLARAWQRQRGSVPNDLERSQQEHAVRRLARHFHARSNVCSNAGRVWLRSREAGLRHRRARSER